MSMLQDPPPFDVPAVPECQLLGRLYAAALSAADPRVVVPRHLPPVPKGRTVVVGVGKAAASMARAVEAVWPGPLSGVVVVPDGAALPLTFVQVHVASHPVPDERSVEGARLLMAAVAHLGPDDLVLALISGGGSSLCAWPVEGMSLIDKQRLTQALLRRGANIAQINTVRKHVSRIKGGRLAVHASPARVHTLVISDIPGDDPAMVASGPTLPDASTCDDAVSVLKRYGLDTAVAGMQTALEAGLWESIKPNHPQWAHCTHALIASAWDGLSAAAQVARQQGWACHVLSDCMEGEAQDVAKAHAAIVMSVIRHQTPFASPCVILSGGEATVTVRGHGRGGRNTEFLLALMLALEPLGAAAHRVFALSAGTDGLDGRAGAAGAWMVPGDLSRLRAQGVDPRACLDDNNSAAAFEAISGLIHTGPTHTNINDFRAILIGPA